MKYIRLTMVLLLFLLAANTLINPNSASGASGAELYRDAANALQKLYAQSSSASALGQRAKAVLVFPKIVKGGFVVGGQYGEGVLFMNGKSAGYYSTVQASYGLQAGLQKYGYALFLMDDAAIDWVNKTGGWEVGTGPSIVIVDTGKATSMSTTTLHSEIYAFFSARRDSWRALACRVQKSPGSTAEAGLLSRFVCTNSHISKEMKGYGSEKKFAHRDVVLPDAGFIVSGQEGNGWGCREQGRDPGRAGAAQYKAFNAQDLKGVMTMYSSDPNCVLMGTGPGEAYVGDEAIGGAYNQFFTRFEAGSLSFKPDWIASASKGNYRVVGCCLLPRMADF